MRGFRHAADARGACGRCSSACCAAPLPNDIEATLEAIRVFQRTAIFRIAIADRLGSLPLMKVSDRLTDTAELVLDFSLRTGLARARREARHAAVRRPPPREAGFAVIGYGKLGGLELGYGSDLDLVFSARLARRAAGDRTATPPLDNERFFTPARAAADSFS